MKAANAEGEPLRKMSNEMKWYIEFNEVEIQEMTKLLDMLEPMEQLFAKLGGELSSNIHLVVPTLKVSSDH